MRAATAARMASPAVCPWRVVDLAEVVDVDDQQRRAAPEVPGPLHLAGQGRGEHPQVAHAGQRVGDGGPLRLAVQQGVVHGDARRAGDRQQELAVRVGVGGLPGERSTTTAPSTELPRCNGDASAGPPSRAATSPPSIRRGTPSPDTEPGQRVDPGHPPGTAARGLHRPGDPRHQALPLQQPHGRPAALGGRGRDRRDGGQQAVEVVRALQGVAEAADVLRQQVPAVLQVAHPPVELLGHVVEALGQATRPRPGGPRAAAPRGRRGRRARPRS